MGTMLLCNVIVQDLGGGQIEVAAIDQAISMEQVGIGRSKLSPNPMERVGLAHKTGSYPLALSGGE